MCDSGDHETAGENNCRIRKNEGESMPFQIVRNDITKMHVDAIVNTANPSVAVGDGVDSAIYKAAGWDELLKAREEIGILNPGEVGITPAFNLGAKYIIHASGPWWEGGKKNEAEVLRSCYDKSLDLAYEHGCESIAFPLLAAGTYGFPKELGIQIAVDSFTAFLEEHEIDITLVVFGSESVSISGGLVEEVASYIDDEYVAQALEEEYRNDGYPEERRERRSERFESVLQSIALPSFLKKSEAESEAEEELDDEAPTFGSVPFEENMAKPCSAKPMEAPMAADMAAPEFLKAPSAKKTGSLEDALKEIYTDSFEKHLQQLINKKGLKNSEVYATANISKQYFSKLLKGQVKPSKEKMLALAVGLRLNLDETIDFLRIAGYALSPISQTDKVVEYFIEHEDYNVLKIDIVLFDYGLDPLSS